MSPLNFLDPLSVENYAVNRLNQLIESRYTISKYCNTSYTDVGKMTPREREYVMHLISEEVKKAEEIREAMYKK